VGTRRDDLSVGTGLPDAEGAREWYRRMVEIRLFERRAQELFTQGRVEGTTHLAQGQEGTIVGAVSAMEADDYMTITYRGHGHALARGMSLRSAFAELMGRSGGCCSGVGGSMHFTEASRGLLGAFAIVGAGLPVALGAAMSSKHLGTGRVALSFFGDGSTNIGTFHETLNMAATWSAPVVFVIENNLYGEYTPMRETTPLDDLADRASAYAMPGVVVDGQDVTAVNATVADAIALAREGGGPSLIEAKTYRYNGHSRTDPAKYRPSGELDAWRERDPIDLLGERLDAAGAQSFAEQKAVWTEIQELVDRCVEEVAPEPAASLDEIRGFVYAG
jgi:acetoin:2,6-dichlorophenolindophenol oxidoreductase subunit alpha